MLEVHYDIEHHNGIEWVWTGTAPGPTIHEALIQASKYIPEWSERMNDYRLKRIRKLEIE